MVTGRLGVAIRDLLKYGTKEISASPRLRDSTCTSGASQVSLETDTDGAEGVRACSCMWYSKTAGDMEHSAAI